METTGPMNQFLNLSSFAEYMLIHEHACVAIRKDMPLDRAALIGCSVTTGVGAVIQHLECAPGRDRCKSSAAAAGRARGNQRRRNRGSGPYYRDRYARLQA